MKKRGRGKGREQIRRERKAEAVKRGKDKLSEMDSKREKSVG